MPSSAWACSAGAPATCWGGARRRPRRAPRARSMRELSDHPRFGPMMRVMPEEQRLAQNRASHERLRRAIEGEWGAYEQNLREQGELYAASEISFSEWYDVFRAFTRYLTPFL